MGNEFQASELDTCLNQEFAKCAAFSQCKFVSVCNVTQAGKTSSETLRKYISKVLRNLGSPNYVKNHRLPRCMS